jgi:hypothetical protein
MTFIESWETFYAEAEKLYLEHPDHVRHTLGFLSSSFSPFGKRVCIPSPEATARSTILAFALPVSHATHTLWQTRYVAKYRHCDGKLELKVTNDRVVRRPVCFERTHLPHSVGDNLGCVCCVDHHTAGACHPTLSLSSPFAFAVPQVCDRPAAGSQARRQTQQPLLDVHVRQGSVCGPNRGAAGGGDSGECATSERRRRGGGRRHACERREEESQEAVSQGALHAVRVMSSVMVPWSVCFCRALSRCRFKVVPSPELGIPNVLSEIPTMYRIHPWGGAVTCKTVRLADSRPASACDVMGAIDGRGRARCPAMAAWSGVLVLVGLRWN